MTRENEGIENLMKIEILENEIEDLKTRIVKKMDNFCNELDNITLTLGE